MRTLFDGELHVGYGQFYLSTDEWTSEFMDACFAGQVNGLCGAGVPGGLWLTTGLHTGSVRLTVEAHDSAPPLVGDWEEVVEASCVLRTAQACLGSDGGEWIDVPGGPLRARYCAAGMDAGRAVGVRDEDDPVADRYLLQLWPAPPAADAVLRRTSAIAAYWHGYVAALPPAGEVARRAAEQRRAMDAVNQEPDRS